MQFANLLANLLACELACLHNFRFPRADGGTNSPRLFTPGETKALAKSKAKSLNTELYYITGGPARHQQVKPKTWRILRHCHDYWSLDSWQLPLSQPRSYAFDDVLHPPWFQHRYFMISLVFEVKIALKILIFFSYNLVDLQRRGSGLFAPLVLVDV